MVGNDKSGANDGRVVGWIDGRGRHERGSLTRYAGRHLGRL
jgi:hypothetical protein